MAIQNGNYVTIKIGANLIGGQKNVTFNESRPTIDKSAKGDDSEQVLPGRYASSVTLDNFAFISDTAQTALRTAIRAGTTVEVNRYENAADIEGATAYVTSIDENHTDMETGSFTVELKITNTWS